MKLKYISNETRQDKNNPKIYYEYGKEYTIGDKKRAKELLDSKLFEEVKEDIKEDTNK